MTKLRALIVASLVLVGTVVGVALNAAAAGAQGTSWTQTTTCPSGLTLTIHASSLRTRTSGTGSHTWWSVTGDVTVTAASGRSLSFAESYVGRDSSPSDSGGTVVSGTSLQFAPNGAPVVVRGTAFLAPGGFLGRVSGTSTSLCAALGG